MEKNKVINKLNKLIAEGEHILGTCYYPSDLASYECVDSSSFFAFCINVISFLDQVLEKESVYITTFKVGNNHRYDKAEMCVKALKHLLDDVVTDCIKITNADNGNPDVNFDAIFSRFHKVVRQLRRRHKNRSTLDVSDEYDVQDLLHAILNLYFDDIRAEEWTPSYAGQCSRMDFLLKKEKIVIEVKMTRAGLSDREVGNQLLEDIQRYRSHQYCESLICFVYDPDGRITNPDGLKSDLETSNSGFVKVYIKPI